MKHLTLLLGVLLFVACNGQNAVKQVTIYPTYGTAEGDNWKIPMRIWVHTPREKIEDFLTKTFAEFGKLNDQEKTIFKHRIANLVADSRSRQDVRLAFDQDPDSQEFRIQNAQGDFDKSDLNGIVQGFIQLSIRKADLLLQSQRTQNGCLNLRVVSEGHRGAGRVCLLSAEGTSVISDIDDTIKITGIPKGKEVVLQNTFLRDFMASPGMAAMYRDMADSGFTFHYVSGGPWQLYDVLSEFLIDGPDGFPAGTFHMKSVPKNLLQLSTWDDLHKLAGGNATVEQKVAQISQLLTDFPKRKFILIGDSGEKDPEVFGKIRNRFGDQVQEIRIRDVAIAKNSGRLADMTIIEPNTGIMSLWVSNS